MEFVIEQGKQPHQECSTLLLPALSIGNVGQLAVDLLVSSMKAERIGYLDDPFVLPCVGNDAYGPIPCGDLALPLKDAATGIYAELMHSDRSLLREWEDCGQPKIVVTCRNQQEMNKLRDAAEDIGLPTFVVADAGRTQVLTIGRHFLLLTEQPYDSIPNFSVADALRLTGIGRNEFIDVMNKCRSKVISAFVLVSIVFI
ncbi:hypothetical protein J1N35_025591 [Gossypium stocksii]|uniref:peptidyl-tRNA hydrolase n=1 Tax=Gossypium stocksii TaxID=47602 RepID=A0A9D3ZYE7_9ROSI|nr:hypothetical protein J1N35_025591 [Gossypium stocksii]